ncbi:hypothetical protein G5I_03443 [Acromyrmex echinatior]|uniref:Uncharacterized protein n=1 Tax=Acromyrmex echinatior TaxID=103372 RepID=F4WD03_ACREC|nr:hypothetical protein G5I_03443 [Acromyrmex echinatior]
MRKRDRKQYGSPAVGAFRERIPEMQFCEAAAAAATTENNPIIRERHVQSLHLGYTDREICRQFVLIINDLMVSRAENRESIRKKDEPELELRRLQELAKLAAIHYNGERKFQKRTDLSHVVHASLHFAQFIRKERDTSTDMRSSESSSSTGKSDNSIQKKINEHNAGKQISELPIPALEELTTLAAFSNNAVRLI